MEFQTFAENGNYAIYVNVYKHRLHILEISSNKQFLYFPDWWKNINKMKDTKIEWNKDFQD